MDLSQRHKHDLFWLVVSARYLYILFLGTSVFSHFLPLEIHKHLRAESIAFLIFILWHCFKSRWIVGSGIKSYLRPAEIPYFSWRDLSRRNKHDLFYLVVLARYSYILFSSAIVFSDFVPFKIHKYLMAESIALLIFVFCHCFNSR